MITLVQILKLKLSQIILIDKIYKLTSFYGPEYLYITNKL